MPCNLDQTYILNILCQGKNYYAAFFRWVQLFLHSKAWGSEATTSATHSFKAVNTIVSFAYLLLSYSKFEWSALQICALNKTVILKNYSSLLLTLVCCIFYKLKIVILELFSCNLFCIELNVNITSFHCFFNTIKKL